jgi:hypothetical protein
MNPGFASNIIKFFQRIFNVSQSHYARHICFIVIYQYCMQTPKIFQDPSRIELRGGLMFHAVVAKALLRHLTYKCSKHAGKQQNVL